MRLIMNRSVFLGRHTLDLILPGPEDDARFLALELKAGALKGARGLVKATGARDFSRNLAQFRQAA